MNLLIQTIINLLYLGLGFYLGTQRYSKDIKTAKKKLFGVKAIITGQVRNVTQGKSGVIYRPNAEKIRSFKKTEEDKAWNETPELRKLKTTEK